MTFTTPPRTHTTSGRDIKDFNKFAAKQAAHSFILCAACLVIGQLNQSNASI